MLYSYTLPFPMGPYEWRGSLPHDAASRSSYLPGGTAILKPSKLQLDPRRSYHLVLLNRGTMVSAVDEEMDGSSACCLAVYSSARTSACF